MRLLFVTHGYPPFGVTGVERVTEQTAVALSDAGHDVTVLNRRPTGAPPLPKLERGTTGAVDLISITGPAPFADFPSHQDRLDRIFERVLLELMPDVVVLSHLMMHSPTYVSVAHRWQIPVVMELHDFYSACERAHLARPSGELCFGPEGGRACAEHCFTHQSDALPRWALRTHLFRQALVQADAVVTPSSFVADYFSRRYRLSSDIHVIPNGVSLEVEPSATAAGRPRDMPLHLASLGAVVTHKGAHIVVDALRGARLAAVRYTLFGPVTEPYVREVRDAAESVAGVDLRAYGPYQPSSLPFLLADVDALIIPSMVWETFSIVAREGMACGVPVIASRLGALPDAIREGENGLLFTPGATSELAAILLRLDTDRGILERLRTGIRPDDWITVAERTRRLVGVLDAVHKKGVEIARNTAGDSELGAVRSLLAS